MADTTSTTQFKADISQLKAAMQQAQRQVRLASSEFQKASAGLDDWSSSATGLQAKIKQLNSTLTSQKRMVELANQEWEKTVKVYGENSAESDRAKMKLNGYEAAVAKTEKELRQYESELKDCEEGTGRFADETEDLEDATNQLNDGFTVMKGALASLVADGIRLAIDAMKEFAKATIETGMSFEQSMAQVGAISGASAEDMELLTEKAKEMGATTKFSATESAEAFNYMAMAGWETEDMLNGISGIMNLAAASGADLATTSDIVTDALTAMGYSAGDAGKLADVMAAASSNANTNVELMGQTFQYAAPLVGALGYSMEDTAVQIGLMANAGIKGQKAGTALRSILSRLSAPPAECAKAMEELGVSLTDSAGKMKSLDEVMGELRTAFAGLDETQKTANAKAIAGQEAMSGLLAIVNAAPADYKKLTKAVKESEGAAQSMADTMNDTVEGQLTLLKSQIEGIQIEIYEKLVPYLREGLETISETISGINWDGVGEKVGKFASQVLELFIKIIENGDGIIDVLKAIGITMGVAFVVSKIITYAGAISSLYAAFKALKTATDVATTSQLLLNAAQAATPIGLVAAGVAAVSAALIYLASKNIEAGEATQVLTDYEKEQIETIGKLKVAYQDMAEARDASVKSIDTEYEYIKDLSNELQGLADSNGVVAEADRDRAEFIITTLNEALGTEIQMIDGVIQNYQEEKDAIYDLINAKKAEAVLRANEDLYTAAIQNKNEALKNLTTAQGIYNQNVLEMEEAEKAYQDAMNMTVDEYAELHGLTDALSVAESELIQHQYDLEQAFTESKAAVGESRFAMTDAETAYYGYINTIKNYEGLSAAIISGDSAKISEALLNMEYDFQTAENSTRKSLENQVKNYEANLEMLKKAIQDGTPGVTQEMVDQAESMVKAAKAELDKLPADAKTAGANSGDAFAKGLNSKTGEAQTAGANLKANANNGLKPTGESKKSGEDFVQGYVDGVTITSRTAYDTAKKLGNNAVNGLNDGQESHSPSAATTRSGENFGQGFINGMNNKLSAIWTAAWNLAKKALAALKAGQQEGSPSKLTEQSGIYFGEGYEVGIESMKKTVGQTAGELALYAYKSLREGQKEGSPSDLTYESGVNFTKGYINGIVSMETDLAKTIRNMAGIALKSALNVRNGDFSGAAKNAADYMSETLNKKTSYMMDKIQFQNKKKLEEFDNTIKKLETERDSKTGAIQAKIDAEKDENTKNTLKNQKAAIEKEYKTLIETQNKYKTAYQSASSEMISEFGNAVKEYSEKAQDLINSTIQGISDKYQQKYDELMQKQDSLVSKLKNAGDLFEISGAGVMTVADVKEQTKAITDYTEKLKKIKGSVSEELFDQIASYDMTEGSAFMDQLLSMSKKDLEAYNKAYTEKMKAAEKAGDTIYKSDFKQVEKDYKKELNDAFKTLPKELEKIGNDVMKGFIKGLTQNTDYMDKEVKTFVKGMVDEFRNLLQIKSPSKVMMQIGDYTGEGFVEGLKQTLVDAKATAQQMAETVSNPLSEIKSNIGNIKSAVGEADMAGRLVTNNYHYNLVQNNTSPKSLSALETYQARRQQIAMVKALT